MKAILLVIFLLLCGNFAKAANKPILIIFHASWCQPCQQMESGVFPLLKAEMSKWHVYSIDTDKYPQYTKAWKVSGIPCIVFAKGNDKYVTEKKRLVGYQNVDKVRQYLMSLKE